jgi:hypothetical protein
MSDTVKTTWLYPPNWDGSYFGQGGPAPSENPKMGWKRMKVQFTNLSDGTGESDAIKLDRSDFFGIDGLPCFKFGIECIEYQTYGMSVVLEWDMAPQQLVCYIPESSSGKIKGPFYPDVGDAYGPGETGDLILTTVAHSANDSYNLTLDILVKT